MQNVTQMKYLHFYFSGVLNNLLLAFLGGHSWKWATRSKNQRQMLIFRSTSNRLKKNVSNDQILEEYKENTFDV